MLGKIETLKKAERADLIRLTVKDLGFPSGATTDEIFERAEELGLELCPSETGPHLRLHYSGKEWLIIAMKQMPVRSGSPFMFHLSWYGDQLKLYGLAKPSSRWNPSSEFVFRLRKHKQ